MGEDTTTKSTKSLFLSKLFLPFFLMLSLMGIAGSALQKAGNLLVLVQLDKNIAPIVKLISAFPVMLLIIAFVVFLRKTAIQSWILYALISFFVILTIVAIWLVPSITKSPSNKLATAIEFLFSGHLGLGLGEAIRQWRLSLILLIIKFLSPALFSVIVWTFINQVSLLSESIKYYIPLAFLSSLPAFFLFSTHFFSSVVTTAPMEHARFLMIGAAVSILLTIFIFRWALQSLPEERWLPLKKEGGELQTTSPIFSLSLAIVGFGVIKAFFNESFKTQVQNILPSGTDYMTLMKQFVTTGNIGGVLVGILCCLGGPFLLKRFGWCPVALLSPLLVLGSILLFVFGIPFDFSLLTLGKIHEILLSGLKMGLLMPVIQIAYLSVPKEFRFRTKGWAELVIAPLLLSIGNGVIGSLELLKKSAAIVPYFGILSILTLVVMSLAIYKLSLRRSMDRISMLE